MIISNILSNMSTKVLQNQKYQSCIDACNDCAESCELCATLVLENKM